MIDVELQHFSWSLAIRFVAVVKWFGASGTGKTDPGYS